MLGKDELGRKVMSYKLYLLIVLLLAGCAEFQTKLDMMQNEQITCRPPHDTLCAGWKI